MRSVGWALTWEFWRKGRGAILSSLILLCILTPLISLAMRTSINAQSPEERETMIISISLSLLFICVFALNTLIILSEGDLIRNPAVMMKRNRTFILPISNASLVAWRMLHGLATVFALSFISIFISNLFLKKHGIALSPLSFSLFTGTCFCFYYAALWYSQKNPWAFLALIILSLVALYSWYRSFNEISDALQIIKSASSFSPGKGIIMAGVMAFSFLLAIQGHKSYRNGDFPSIYEWTTGRKSPMDLFSFKEKRFSSITKALGWFYIRRDPWRIFKLLIVFMFLPIFYIVLMGVKLPEEAPGVLMNVFVFISFYILFFPFSLVYEQNAFSPGSYESVLPVTSGENAASLLRNKIKEMMLGVAFAVSGVLVIILSARAGLSVNELSIMKIHKMFLNTDFWNTGIKGYAAISLYYILLLWGFWINIGIGSALWISGRTKVWMFALIIPLICIALVLTLWGIPAYPFIIGTIVILGVMFCFYKSVKEGILRRSDIMTNAAIWIGASAAFSLALYQVDRTIFPKAAVMVFAGIALALAPFALAPMALHWNRHR